MNRLGRRAAIGAAMGLAMAGPAGAQQPAQPGPIRVEAPWTRAMRAGGTGLWRSTPICATAT
jgi:hypothetical protein